MEKIEITNSMAQSVQLIVSDIDGTLVDDDSQISKDSIMAIKNAKKSGIHFALATGRNNNMTRALVEVLGNDIYTISNNGALVYDHKNEKVIYSNSLTRKQSIGILSEVFKRGWDFICYSQNIMYYSIYDNLIASKLLQVENDAKKLNTVPNFIHKLVRSVEEIEEIDNIYKIGVREFNNPDFKIVAQIAKENGAELKNSGEKFNAIFPKGISKEVGLSKLQEYLDINKENTVAIGDYDNDLPLFERAKYKVGVESGSKNLLEQANIITASNKNDGVAVFVNKLLENRIGE